MQTIPEAKIERHPFKQMLDNQIAVSLCSDNCTVSHTNVAKEIRLAVDTFELSPKQLKDLVISGFKRSFMPVNYPEKREYNRKIIDYYEMIEREFKVVN